MDDAPSTRLTDQGIARLRAMAEGNGLDPQKIIVMNADEKDYILDGTMTLSPICETENRRYGEAVRGKNFQLLPTFDALNTEAERRQKAFKGRPDWIPAVKDELQKTPGKGWGLDGAKIILPERAVTLAASESCVKCKGQKVVTCEQCLGKGAEICTQCRGQRTEFCITCAGSGVNPQNHSQPCLMCHGQRTMACRMCRGQGQKACAMCQGRRGVPCKLCNGSGQTTEEIAITFGATTHFNLKTENLPSSMRRGLDRLGLPNLPKGHADVDVFVPQGEEELGENEEVIHDMHEAMQDKPQEPVLHFRATMPFADLRVDFGGKKAAIGIFGKRAVFIDIPPFLDEALRPWRDKLEAARKGKGALDEVIKARAMKEAVALNLQGKGNMKEFRRLYPVGISANVVDEILRGTKQAIKRFTLTIRTAAAVLGGALGAGIFAAAYFSPLPARLAHTVPFGAYILDFAPMLLAAGLGWMVLNLSTYFVLRRNFPDIQLATRQTTGKTGYAMLAAIIVIGFIALSLSPARPPWLPLIPH